MDNRVLVADDDRITRTVLCEVLRRNGFEPIAVENGREALDVLHSTEVQLVLTDWSMPEMDGLDLCRAIRAGEFARYIYVVMVTSHTDPQHVVLGMEAGADDFITKPFNPMEVIVRLRSGERLISLDSAEMTIFALARLAESRDPETGAHLERVRSYCRVLAEELRRCGHSPGLIDEEFCRLIFQTSPLHDIGKVAIPDAVLLKPGRLTPEEYAIMKTHTTHGAATLEAAMERYPNVGFLRMAYQIAMTHHEKFDGTGYPCGVSGTDIPMCGRIMAVADVYDALTSKRVYKDAFSHEKARDIIRSDSGTHFDPDVVDAFDACESEIVSISRRHREDAVEAHASRPHDETKSAAA